MKIIGDRFSTSGFRHLAQLWWPRARRGEGLWSEQDITYKPALSIINMLTRCRMAGALAAEPNMKLNAIRQRNSTRASPVNLLNQYNYITACAALTMRAWPVARSIFDAPYVREANEGTTSWISAAPTCWADPRASIASDLIEPGSGRFLDTGGTWQRATRCRARTALDGRHASTIFSRPMPFCAEGAKRHY